MRKTKTELKQVEVTTEEEVICDKCGKKVDPKFPDAFDFNFEYNTGQAYPEFGTGEKCSMDLCPDCAEGLLDLLKSEGYRVNESEWDY